MSAAFDRVVAALGDRVTTRRDGQVTARCPSHEDGTASLSVTAKPGKVAIFCHGGCGSKAIVGALGLTLAALFDTPPKKQGGRGSLSSRKRLISSQTSNTVGLTLAQYAEAKRLPVAYLETLGLSTLTYQTKPAIRIPYFTPEGAVSAVQFRLSLAGDRFRWRRGSKPLPYGLDRRPAAPASLTLVEGPSDCQTLWHHGFPAIGLPSASTWRPEWDRYLDGFAEIYVNLEADQGGAAVEEWLPRASFRARVRLVRLDGAKDPSALYYDFVRSAVDETVARLASSTACIAGG